MKTKFLKIEKPCHENWENMTPNEKGRFCDSCKKTVIDFTQSTPLQIAQEIKNKKNLCIRMTSEQLKRPLLELELKNNNEYKLPYSHIAVGLMIATTLSCNQNIPAPSSQTQTESVPTSDTNSKSDTLTQHTDSNNVKSENTTRFCGIVTSEKGELIENAKITFVTIHKMLSTYSAHDGTFSIDLPSELIDNDNVILVSYYDIKNYKKYNKRSYYYQKSDYLLTKNDISSEYKIIAKEAIIRNGYFFYSSKESAPIIIINGIEVPYKEYLKAEQGLPSSCSIEHKDFHYFESKAAVALYGKKAKVGLCMFYDNE